MTDFADLFKHGKSKICFFARFIFSHFFLVTIFLLWKYLDTNKYKYLGNWLTYFSFIYLEVNDDDGEQIWIVPPPSLVSIEGILARARLTFAIDQDLTMRQCDPVSAPSDAERGMWWVSWALCLTRHFIWLFRDVICLVKKLTMCFLEEHEEPCSLFKYIQNIYGCM